MSLRNALGGSRGYGGQVRRYAKAPLPQPDARRSISSIRALYELGGLVKEVVPGLSDELESHRAEAIESLRRRRKVLVTTPVGSGRRAIADIAAFLEFGVDTRNSLIVTATRDEARRRHRELDDLRAYSRLSSYMNVALIEGAADFPGDLPEVVVTDVTTLAHRILPAQNRRKVRSFLDRLGFVALEDADAPGSDAASNHAFVYRRLRRVLGNTLRRCAVLVTTSESHSPKQLATQLTAVEFDLVIRASDDGTSVHGPDVPVAFWVVDIHRQGTAKPGHPPGLRDLLGVLESLHASQAGPLLVFAPRHALGPNDVEGLRDEVRRQSGGAPAIEVANRFRRHPGQRFGAVVYLGTPRCWPEVRHELTHVLAPEAGIVFMAPASPRMQTWIEEPKRFTHPGLDDRTRIAMAYANKTLLRKHVPAMIVDRDLSLGEARSALFGLDPTVTDGEVDELATLVEHVAPEVEPLARFLEPQYQGASLAGQDTDVRRRIVDVDTHTLDLHSTPLVQDIDEQRVQVGAVADIDREFLDRERSCVDAEGRRFMLLRAAEDGALLVERSLRGTLTDPATRPNRLLTEVELDRGLCLEGPNQLISQGVTLSLVEVSVRETPTAIAPAGAWEASVQLRGVRRLRRDEVVHRSFVSQGAVIEWHDVDVNQVELRALENAVRAVVEATFRDGARLGGVHATADAEARTAYLTVYDRYADGGVRIAADVFADFEQVLARSFAVLSRCRCSHGCARCCHPTIESATNPADPHGGKRGAFALLEVFGTRFDGHAQRLFHGATQTREQDLDEIQETFLDRVVDGIAMRRLGWKEPPRRTLLWSLDDDASHERVDDNSVHLPSELVEEDYLVILAQTLAQTSAAGGEVIGRDTDAFRGRFPGRVVGAWLAARCVEDHNQEHGDELLDAHLPSPWRVSLRVAEWIVATHGLTALRDLAAAPEGSPLASAGSAKLLRDSGVEQSLIAAFQSLRKEGGGRCVDLSDHQAGERIVRAAAVLDDWREEALTGFEATSVSEYRASRTDGDAQVRGHLSEECLDCRSDCMLAKAAYLCSDEARPRADRLAKLQEPPAAAEEASESNGAHDRGDADPGRRPEAGQDPEESSSRPPTDPP